MCIVYEGLNAGISEVISENPDVSVMSVMSVMSVISKCGYCLSEQISTLVATDAGGVIGDVRSVGTISPVYARVAYMVFLVQASL